MLFWCCYLKNNWRLNIIQLPSFLWKWFKCVFCCSSRGLPGDDTVCLLSRGGALTLCAVESSPARDAPALSIIGATLGSVVTVTRVETIWTPVPRGTGYKCQRLSQAHNHTFSHTSSKACIHEAHNHLRKCSKIPNTSKYSTVS